MTEAERKRRYDLANAIYVYMAVGKVDESMELLQKFWQDGYDTGATDWE